ncbi:TPA: acetyltransferase [Escherichia coli]|nr:acetyltransferase [Escherichia coli]
MLSYLKINNGGEYKNVDIASSAVIDNTRGPVWIGEGSQICHGAYIAGPVVIGSCCMIGNHAVIRGGTYISNYVRIGFSTEVKGSVIARKVIIGPQCYIGDSVIEESCYLGALVRTSNHRLDGKTVNVIFNGEFIDTGKYKLGCLIRHHSSLGVGVVILPGRIILPKTMIGPRIIVEKNLPVGNYKLQQRVVKWG